MRFEANQVLLQIQALKILHPDIWDDDDDKLLTLESQTNADTVLSMLVEHMQEAKAFAGSIVMRITELELRLDRYERREKAFRDLAFRIMTAADIRKKELPEATLSIAKGRQKLVGNADPDKLPDELCILKRELNRGMIIEELKAGRTVPGFQLSNSEPHLTIRTR